MRIKHKTVMDQMNAEKPDAVLADLEAKHGCAAPPCSADMWTYSKYRASLRRNGHPFAIVTPDGKNALNENDIEILLTALNGNPPNEKGQR